MIIGCASTVTDPNAAFRGKTAAQIYQVGASNFSKQDYDSAINAFEALDALYPFSKYSKQADLDLIDAYYQSGDSVSASAAADRFLKLYPRSNEVDYALYMKGLANFSPDRGLLQKYIRVDEALRDASTEEQAFQDFTTLVYRFPDSAYAPDARKRLIYLKDQFAKRDVEIARYYLKRKAYVAAANRAANVVEHYSQTQQVEPALIIMIRAYQHLGLKQREHDTVRVLAKNFPNAAFLKTKS